MEWLLIPILAGSLLALVGGPLGSFIIWQRMAYIGESIAHSALLGVALAIVLNISMTAMIIIICCTVALLLNRLNQHSTLSVNTLLAIIAHTALATGLVIISLIPEFRLDIGNFLFGDLLTIGTDQLQLVVATSILVSIFLLLNWHALISMAVNSELAFVDGIRIQRLQLLLNLAMALLIAVSIKVVGVLLIVSLLIIPAATSRKWARSPESMAIIASLLGLIYVVTGLGLSWVADTPTGPSIVALAGFGYLVSQALPKGQTVSS